MELDWLKQWSLYAPNAIAFKDADTGEQYSYAEIYRFSCGLARKLELKRGQRMGVLANNELEYVPLFFAAQRVGAILVPINVRLSAREVAHIVNDASPELLIVQEPFKALATDLKVSRTLEFETLRTWLAELRDDRALCEPLAFVTNETDPCMILYTSGTTGAPKGAMITNKMLHWNSLNTGLRLNLSQNDVNLSFLPFFHTSGWNVLLTPFVHRGARTVLMRKFEADRVLELCEKEKVTVLFGVPTTMDLMYRSPLFNKVDLKSVRYAIVGGEPMPIELIKRWDEKGIPVRQGFGLTEFGPSVFSLNEEDALRKIGSIGFPNFYIEARVVDNDRNEVKRGEIGELILRGPVCSPGYWRNAAATEEAIRDGWFHTGDLVRQDDEGYYYVAGRKKDMFISGAENVYPAEVERYLSTHPAIREVAVIGVPDEKWGEVGKAYVATHAGKTLTKEEFNTFCLAGLAKYKIPKQIEFLAELPKGDSGKILKRKLRETDVEA